MKRTRAFTLVELLVVIAVIAVLMAILMPTLNRAREQGKRVRCMANLKNLTLCWTMYADDYEGRLPAGGTEGDTCWIDHTGLRGLTDDTTWLYAEDGIVAIKAGVLWPYTKDVKLYRCPTATSTETRTYVMPDSYASEEVHHVLAQNHGAPLSLLNTNRNRIKRPAERMAFLDENFSTTATWSIFYNSPRWWDPVPLRHGVGTVVSLADGHIEYWKWRDARTIDFAKRSSDRNLPDAVRFANYFQANNEDMYRIVKSVWGRVGWE
jgi:prepilin-type N-terminal cleavage/methylation domain-containing protein